MKNLIPKMYMEIKKEWFYFLFSSFNKINSNITYLPLLQAKLGHESKRPSVADMEKLLWRTQLYLEIENHDILLPKFFWPTVRNNCSSDLKFFANSWPLAWNFKSFSWSLKQLFLTVGQNNFGNKIPQFSI